MFVEAHSLCRMQDHVPVCGVRLELQTEIEELDLTGSGALESVWSSLLPTRVLMAQRASHRLEPLGPFLGTAW